MKINALTKVTTTMALAAGLGIAATAAFADADRVLRVQTSSNASHFTLAFLNEQWVPRLETMTGGALSIELLPIESVVPRRETAEAVAAGILDGDLTSINYFTGVDPAFALMGDLIAGYDSADQIQTYCSRGGGREMLQTLYDTHFPGVHVVGCGAYAREALVSTVPINGVADLEGILIRAPEGLASEVFRRAGATPVALPGSETYGALERGVIDAADNSAYANNDANGMHDIARFPLFPGIHSTPILQFTLNQDTWESLSETEQEILVVWYEAAYNDMRRAVEIVDQQLVARDRAAGELTIIDWPQEERDALRVIAQEAWADFAAESELAMEVYNSHLSFMREAGLLEAE